MVILGRLNDSSTNSLVAEKDFLSAKHYLHYGKVLVSIYLGIYVVDFYCV